MVDRMMPSTGGTDIARLQKERLGSSERTASQTPKVGASAGAAQSSDAVSLSGVADSGMIKSMAAAAPVDTTVVEDIKTRIQQGNYPLDLEKLTDRLMDAYREMTQ